MLVKVHRNREGKVVVAICDKELIGKRLEDGKVQLDLSSDFYKGEERLVSEIADLMRNANIINLVGEKSIRLALREELISKENVKYVCGIPHAQVILLQE